MERLCYRNLAKLERLSIKSILKKFSGVRFNNDRSPEVVVCANSKWMIDPDFNCQSCKQQHDNTHASLINCLLQDSSPEHLTAKSFRKRYSKIQLLSDIRRLRHEFPALPSYIQTHIITSPLHIPRTNGRRGFSTSSRAYNNQRDESRNQADDDKDDEEEEEEDDEQKDEREKRAIHIFGNLVFVACVISLFLMQNVQSINTEQQVTWNEFIREMLAKGEVEEVWVVDPGRQFAIIRLHAGAVYKGQRARNSQFLMKIDPYGDKFEEHLRKAEAKLGVKPEAGVPVSYRRDRGMLGMGLMLLVAFAVGALLTYYNGKLAIKILKPTDMFDGIRKAKFLRGDTMSQRGKGTTFSDIAGLKEAKMEIMEFVDYLKTPDRFKQLGAKVPHGALLLGPPGCGKTLLAKAVANESKVPFLAMAGSEFCEIVGGLGAARVRDLFKEAQKKAPCIIYVDEIDAIGRKRQGSSAGSGAEGEHTLNQLLVELDGMGTKDGVIMIASTNRADVLDKALLRPGRFDRHITIDLPTLEERREIFEMYLSKLKLEREPHVYAPKLAQMSPGMSGADINNICNEAAIHAARIGKKIISGANFDYAVERVIAGTEKKSRLLSPDEKKIVAYHESGHALVGWLLKYTDALLRISIVPRTNSALGFTQYSPSDQKLYSKEELFERMCMALGGRVAETIIFNKITSGAADDLRKVTSLAYNQIRHFGMNDAVGCVSFPQQRGDDKGVGVKPYSKAFSQIMDQEARKLVAEAFRHTEEVLKNNKDKLSLLANKLLLQETLTYDEIEALIGPPPHGKKHVIEAHGWEGIMPSDDNNNNNSQ